MSDHPTHEGYGRRGKLTGDEWDAFSRKARPLIARFARPGVTKSIKRQFNRKKRHQAHQQLRGEPHE